MRIPPEGTLGVRAEPSKHAHRHLGEYRHYKPVPDKDAEKIQEHLLGINPPPLVGDKEVMIVCAAAALVIAWLMWIGAV